MSRFRARTVFWVACLAFVGSLAWVAIGVGGDLPAQFDGSGAVTRRESSSSFVLSLGGGGAVLAALFGGGRWWIPRLPSQMINLPSIDAHRYWTAPERRSDFDSMISGDLEWIGAASFALLTWMTVVSGTAGESVSVWLLAIPTAAFVVGIVAYAVYIIRGGKYRVRP